MRSLKEVITAVRQELESALNNGTPLPKNSTLTADRVVVTLRFTIKEDDTSGAPRVQFDSATDAANANSVAIEFRCNKEGILANKEAATAVPEKKTLTESEANRLIQQFSQVFGAPGFDSSARATVFCEALENLSDEQAREAISGAASNSEKIKRAQGLIKRVCQAGPAGAREGAAILAGAFGAHESSGLLNLVSKVWKTQQDWLG